ncbi:phosphatidylglycerophosphatase A family protein [Varunaivibrio sulfuroxidans]|uniref:Phosphatidylglycerophosphatase A n=1 Tax=Varunaivibrio sulfuroxidans TaxID=1773489 RepID=A0A4R3JEI4_9PROT|nr:phosphatidylglycerophosphatase A [Varunaivibrio sulfuroxidans]TCS64207.1 phosphatidylglycerophosphatase [Varunaivibrio sulfuroxidans]WES31349.1 phosphatidylglycerophosphatase A [Varunaivibrio sulfuroxidans]
MSFKIAKIAATWFGAGLAPKAPGTWGTLAALPFAWGIILIAGRPGLAAAAVGVYALGIWAAQVYMAHTKTHDPGQIVIDEVVGVWIALLPATLSPASFFFGFALFRFFDIVKPWPISWVDRNVGGAHGVMLDDVLAGIFAAILLFFAMPYLP